MVYSRRGIQIVALLALAAVLLFVAQLTTMHRYDIKVQSPQVFIRAPDISSRGKQATAIAPPRPNLTSQATEIPEKRLKPTLPSSAPPLEPQATVVPELDEDEISRRWRGGEGSSSCDRNLGNSYGAGVSMCSGGAGPSEATSDIVCHHSGIYKSSYCILRSVKLVPSRIRVSRGGEPLDSVLGQPEEAELPQFQPGALLANCTLQGSVVFDNEYLPHYLGDLLRTTQTSTEPLECPRWEHRPTFAITRYEYANIFHTATDWYNIYQAMATVLGARRHTAEMVVLLLDGHPQGGLDDSWSQVFGDAVRVKHLSSSSGSDDDGVCYSQLVLASPGYRSPLFPGYVHDCRASDLVADFSRFFTRSYGEWPKDRPSSRVNKSAEVCYVFRRDYLAHPRQGSSRASRKIRNEAELLGVARATPGVGHVRALELEKMDFDDQVRAVMRCDVLVGMHGAGLTQLLFLPGWGGVLEMSHPAYMSRTFFDHLSRLRGLVFEKQTTGIHGSDEEMIVDVSIHSDALARVVRTVLQ